MSLAATVKAMAAAGCSVEQIADVVARIDEERLAKGRAGNAERQKRWRAAHPRNEANDVTSVTFDEPDHNANNGVTPADSNASNAVSECDKALPGVIQRDERDGSRTRVEVDPLLTSVGKEERKKEAAGRTLPSDWAPSQSHFAKAAAKGRTREWVLEQAEAMREWATANRNRAIARKANWDQAFGGWLRRELEKPSSSRSNALNGFANGKGSLYFVEVGSPQYAAWRAYAGDKIGRFPNPRNTSQIGWSVPSEWPPGSAPPSDDNGRRNA